MPFESGRRERRHVPTCDSAQRCDCGSMRVWQCCVFSLKSSSDKRLHVSRQETSLAAVSANAMRNRICMPISYRPCFASNLCEQHVGTTFLRAWCLFQATSLWDKVNVDVFSPLTTRTAAVTTRMFTRRQEQSPSLSLPATITTYNNTPQGKLPKNVQEMMEAQKEGREYTGTSRPSKGRWGPTNIEEVRAKDMNNNMSQGAEEP